MFKPKKIKDNRGHFFESYRTRWFFDIIKEKVQFVQDNQSFSRYGTIRGLHFQKPPFQQAKLVRAVVGSVLDTVLDLKKKFPGLQTVVIKSGNVDLSPVPEHIKIEFSALCAMQNGTATISSSGTATLECALANLPTVVCYKMSYLNWALFNLFSKVEHISIVNLIAKKKIIPELIQNKMTPKNIVKEILPFLDLKSKTRMESIKHFGKLRKNLGQQGVFDRIANFILG